MVYDDAMSRSKTSGVSVTIRTTGVMAGASGVSCAAWCAWWIVDGLRQPISEREALVTALTLGLPQLFACLAVVLAVLFLGMSALVIKDAVGACTGRAAGRLFIVCVLGIVLGLLDVLSDTPSRSDIVFLSSLTVITVTTLIFVVGTLRTRMQNPNES